MAPRPNGSPSQPPVAADLVLVQTQAMLAPLIRWLVTQGVGYPQLAQALREVYLDTARASLEAEGKRVTDAAISLRTGVHRKEVRAHTEQRSARSESGAGPALAKSPQSSVAEQVFTRWITDAAYRGEQGEPATLAIAGPAPSFDSLVSSVTRDFARRTVLDELVRLGLVEETGLQVAPRAQSATPPHDQEQLLRTFSLHVADHIASCAANLDSARAGSDERLLENSLYGQGLSDASIAQLSHLAREVWKPVFQQMVSAAQQRYDLDGQAAEADTTGTDTTRPRGRMRFGVYFYSEPDR
jgi:hypothetical protein